MCDLSAGRGPTWAEEHALNSSLQGPLRGSVSFAPLLSGMGMSAGKGQDPLDITEPPPCLSKVSLVLWPRGAALRVKTGSAEGLSGAWPAAVEGSRIAPRGLCHSPACPCAFIQGDFASTAAFQ